MPTFVETAFTSAPVQVIDDFESPVLPLVFAASVPTALVATE